MEYGCIAERLSHSFSKDIHSRLGDYEYELCELNANELDAFFSEKNFKGINVTIPYKTDVIKYLDEVSAEAKRINAVNTIANVNGVLKGYNTDYFGMVSLIKHYGIELKGKHVAVLGSGGTSKTACAVAEDMGAESVAVVSRKKQDGFVTYPDMYLKHRNVQVVINTTPCGMFPEIGAAALDIRKFPNVECVIDAVYNPLRSKLVCDALACGIKAVGGLYMLVAQAAYASAHFFNDDSFVGKIDDVYSRIVRERTNVVLIGMPGSGKTTVGAALSQKLGKSFSDTDALVEKFDGRHPSQIITESGEQYFRLLERSVAAAVSLDTGKVIATGGGIVLDRRNTALLKENGRVYFINTPIENIVPTDDRPLSSTREALEKVWNERKELYYEAADKVIEDCGSTEKIIQLIEEDFCENSCY